MMSGLGWALYKRSLSLQSIVRGATVAGALIFAGFPVAGAETVHGHYTLTCWNYEDAITYASKPSYPEIRRQLGCGDGYAVKIIERGGGNCKTCRDGRYMCQGYVVAYCESMRRTVPAPYQGRLDDAARSVADKPDNAVGQAPASSWMDTHLANFEWRENESAARWRELVRRHQYGGTALGEVLARVPNPVNSSRAAERCDKALYTYWHQASKSCKSLTLAAVPDANFNTQYRSGGAGVHVYDFPQRPVNGATLTLRRDFFGIPDRIVVSFITRGEERRVLDTGMVSYAGTHSLPAFSGDSVRVIVTGGGDGTSWNFTLTN